jgi:hypothetical protein
VNRLYSDAFFSCSHHLDLLKLRSFDSKIDGHLYELFWIYKVFGVGAELFQGRHKLTTRHALRNLEAEFAFTILLILQTEFTNLQITLLSDSKTRPNGVFNAPPVSFENESYLPDPARRYPAHRV